MITVLDVENTVQWGEEGRKDGTPYHPDNKLVSVGFCEVDEHAYTIGDVSYVFLFHDLLGVPPVELDLRRRQLQGQLDRTTLLVGHNLKYDLQWLLESGFSYSGAVYDTMIGEYILARGQRLEVSLEASCIRRNVARKKSELVDDYFRNRVGYERMPVAVVEEYGRGDIQSTAELFVSQRKLYELDENAGLIPTLDMMNSFLVCLTDMERNGVAIDLDALNQVAQEYQAEKAALEAELALLVYDVMGDTPVSLSSPEQLSQVVYSRRVIDKKVWEETFATGTDDNGLPKRRPKMSQSAFTQAVRDNTERMRKTRAVQCPDCLGKGFFHKTKVNGDPWAKPTQCRTCLRKVDGKDKGTGVVYEELAGYAGLKMAPRDINDTSSNGFSTKKLTLAYLAQVARNKGNEKAARFLDAVVRLSAIDSYLASFIGGIARNTRADGILHARYNQCITATGRLSSADPNLQNFPRGRTFPVRKAFVSRFKGGTIMEADYAQLEFRVAGELSGCAQVALDIANKVDVHNQTADVLTRAGQRTDRQGAKSHTFKPLYGGMSGTEAEVTYYQWFVRHYEGVGKWQEKLCDDAVKTKIVRLPSGREYKFPKARRNGYGGVTGRTKIVNYPVQGFATGDLVPLAVLRIWHGLRLSGLQSVLCNTVHDSIVIDCYPGEEKAVARIVRAAMLGLPEEVLNRYGYSMRMPLDIEIKIGPNWMDSQVFPPEIYLAA